jgi:hypothetical protein
MKRITPSLLWILIFPVLAFAQSATVIKENANLRGTATSTGKVVTVLSYGTELEVIKQTGAWFLVQSPEFAGWLHGNTIEYQKGNSSWRTITEAAPPPPYPVAPIKTLPDPGTRRGDTAPSISENTSIPEPTSSSPTALCEDGTYSYSLNHSGTCSHHGGVSLWLDGSTNTVRSVTRETPSSSSGETVNVKGYYRKDGTYVRPHTRSAPRRN